MEDVQIKEDEQLDGLTERLNGPNDAVKTPPKADLITMTQGQLDTLLKSVTDKYDVLIEKADDRLNKLKLQLELNSKQREIKGGASDPRVKVGGPRFRRPLDHMSMLSEPFEKSQKDKKLRFVNTHSDIRSLRRMQGYEPIRDDAGDEVRYMDMVLMEMPMERFVKEIKEPREADKEFRKQSIKPQFEDVARSQGLETFGDITYDNGE